MTDMYLDMQLTEDVNVLNAYHLPDAIIHTKFQFLCAMINGMPLIPVCDHLSP